MTRYTPDDHLLRQVPVEPWMFRRAREQAELLMQIAMQQPVPKPETPRKQAA